MSSKRRKSKNSGLGCGFGLIILIIMFGAYFGTTKFLEFRDRDRHPILKLELAAEAVSNTGKPYVEVTTNLPDGTAFSVNFRAQGSNTSLDSDMITIQDGKGVSKEFVREDDDAYPNGKYSLRIEASERRQTTEVIDILGKGYKYVEGDDVSENPYDTQYPGMVYKNLSLEIEDSDTENQELVIPDPLASFAKTDTDETEAQVQSAYGGGHYNTALNGRGNADRGREEPSYKNVIGYAVIERNPYDLEHSDTCFNTPWSVPYYDSNHNQVGTLNHKTEVLVKSQSLTHEGYGGYSGYLTVERTDTGEEIVINVRNFMTNPYWTMTDLAKAALEGDYIAEYHFKSGHKPVHSDGSEAEIDEGTKVLVIRTTGTYGRKGPDRSINQVEAYVFRQWKNGYGGVSVFFNTGDLTILY